MSAQGGSFGNAGKKAVHVKWAGKTIALGTFPAAEADEKCARAKALTRAWRSTMRPKPSRDWVMLELERLGVRVVSGRLGRKAGEEDEAASPGEKKSGSIGSSPGPVAGATVDQSGNLGWGTDAELNSLMARRNSSLGLSMMGEGRRGSLSSLGQVVGLETGDPTMPPHRPLVGGGAAAAYEAARHDHFTQKSAEQQRRASSLGLGSLASGGLGNMGMSVNPNQHYEMLKLHHMNLLNEIQETTLMMNLYQQQQLQQQQQQLQQQASAEQMGGADSQMAMLLQQQGGNQSGLDPMFAASQLQQQRASLGLGGSQLGGGSGGGSFGGTTQMQMMRDQQVMQGSGGGAAEDAPGSSGVEGGQQEQGSGELEARLAQLKEDMAKQGEGEGAPAPTSSGEAASPENKRSADAGEEAEEPATKRSKVEEEEGGDDKKDEDGGDDAAGEGGDEEDGEKEAAAV